jgi:hypothetical protein
MATGAIKITKPSIVGLQGGGSRDVFPGEVLYVGKGQELSEDDGRYMIGVGRAVECERSEKGKAKKAEEGKKGEEGKK